MKIEELTPELVEKAKKCETREERLAFIRENGIELNDEQLEAVSGGGDEEPKVHTHIWAPTGRTRPGAIWGDIWPDEEVRCDVCGITDWKW
jgi:hypothetical protein